MDNPAHVTRLGFEDLLFRFRDQAIARTDSIKEWKVRESQKSLVVSPSTMIDLANEILKKALGSDSNGVPDNTARKGKPNSLYYPFAAIAIDPVATPMRGEFGRRLPVRPMRIPNDPQQRLVHLRIDQYMVRMQTVFYGTDTQTIKELAEQFVLFLQLPFQGRINCEYRLLGTTQTLKAAIVDRDLLPQKVDTGLMGVHAIALDSEWRLKVPTLYDKNGNVIDEDGTGDDSIDLAQGLDIIVQAIVYKEYSEPEIVELTPPPLVETQP